MEDANCLTLLQMYWDYALLPLDELARELGVHIRTLQAAARTGRERIVTSGQECRRSLSDNANEWLGLSPAAFDTMDRFVLESRLNGRSVLEEVAP
jgi:hypothetical protein